MLLSSYSQCNSRLLDHWGYAKTWRRPDGDWHEVTRLMTMPRDPRAFPTPWMWRPKETWRGRTPYRPINGPCDQEASCLSLTYWILPLLIYRLVLHHQYANQMFCSNQYSPIWSAWYPDSSLVVFIAQFICSAFSSSANISNCLCSLFPDRQRGQWRLRRWHRVRSCVWWLPFKFRIRSI